MKPKLVEAAVIVLGYAILFVIGLVLPYPLDLISVLAIILMAINLGRVFEVPGFRKKR